MVLPESLDTGSERKPEPAEAPVPLPPDTPAGPETKEFNMVDFMRRSIQRDTMLMQQNEALEKRLADLESKLQGGNMGQGTGDTMQQPQQNGFIQALPTIIEMVKPFLEKFAEMIPMTMAEDKGGREYTDQELEDMEIGRQIRREWYRQQYPRGRGYDRRSRQENLLPTRLHR